MAGVEDGGPVHEATSGGGLLIANAEVDGVGTVDVRCRDGVVAELAPHLPPTAAETRLDARGGALLPGLHDHHIHLLALAAASRSVPCGPPQVADKAALRDALRQAPGNGWIRGVGYHESVAGLLDRRTLDQLQAERPVRIQHRSGKMWFLNGPALRALGMDAANGQLFRGDAQLRRRLPADPQLRDAVAEASALLASYGVTGVTDATPDNNPQALRFLQAAGLRQRLYAMGDESLAAGPLKIMLDDAALPRLPELRDRIARAHQAHRPVAMHCVTRTELVFALAALDDAGAMPGDRIEHASVADDDALRLLRGIGGGRERIAVVTQPNFIAERGDAYRADVPAKDLPWLYRGRGFLDADIPLGGGTDAPFGKPDPWRAMRAAVHRRTGAGAVLGAEETLTPERALALFTTPAQDPGGAPRKVEAGATADLCLMNAPWRRIRTRLVAEDVAATVLDGRLLWQPEGTRRNAGAEPARAR